MRRINRKIKRGTLGHRDNPIVIEYENLYHIGHGLIFQVIRTYGDSKYSHNLCKYISEYRKNNKTSGVKFEKIIEDYEKDIA